MNIRNKLLTGAVMIAVLPAGLVGLVSAWSVGEDARTAMQHQVREHLTSIRETKRH